MKLLPRRFSRESGATKKATPSPSKLQHIEPELLMLILSPLADVNSDETFFNKSIQGNKKASRSSTLRATGLVCRSWHAVSQDLLYEHPQPKSYAAVRKLYKTISKDRVLANRVKSLAPPIFSSWYPQPRKTSWRARRIYLCFSRAGVEISENDYHAMLRLFHAVSLRCPKLSQISLPVSQLAGQYGLYPELCLGEWQTSRITTLTLSPLVFPHTNKRHRSSGQLRPICFPNLKSLTVLDLSLFVVDVVTCIQAPTLESLTIDGACGAYSVLKTLIDSVKDTLRSLEVKRILFYREADTFFDFDDDAGGFLAQVSITDTLYPESLPPGLKHLAVEATSSPRFSDDILIHNLPFFVPYARTISTLETLSLSAAKESSFVELEYSYQSLRTLRIDYMNSGLTSTQDSHTFKMVESLARFIKNREVLAPELKSVELKWRFVKTSTCAWLVYCLAYCLQRRCEAYGVQFELELEGLNDCFEAYAWLNAEEWALDRRRWSKNDRFRVLPMVDRCLSKLGYKAY